MQTHLEKLLALWGEISDVSKASDVLSWDQETYMPPKGQPARGQLLSTLAGIRHAKLTADELNDAIEAAADEVAEGSAEERQVREAQRLVARARRVPTELAKALAQASSDGLAAWQKARAASDFGLFEDALETIVNLTKQQAAAIDPDGNPYEVLMDDFEPGAKEADVAAVFAELRAELSPLVKAVADSGRPVDESPARGTFAPESQLAFARQVSEAMGFDFQAGRLDKAAHPFCSGFNSQDVRLTWRHLDDDFRSALYGVMHETGHGLYEQGLPEAWARTPIGSARSMSVHESQSRLWENLVGRSRGFWNWALPMFHQHFPAKQDVTVDALYPALHTVNPTLIRVEADEGTYNLHIIARFEIERRLFRGEIGVSDLPEVWDQTYEDLLGIRPKTVEEGVLQDIHWSMGAFGYFPTYALGNLVNAQLFEAIERELGPQEANFARGEFGPLLAWLREHIHVHASRYQASELVERATGAPLSSAAFLRYIKRVTEDVYGVAV